MQSLTQAKAHMAAHFMRTHKWTCSQAKWVSSLSRRLSFSKQQKYIQHEALRVQKWIDCCSRSRSIKMFAARRIIQKHTGVLTLLFCSQRNVLFGDVLPAAGACTACVCDESVHGRTCVTFCVASNVTLAEMTICQKNF